MGKFLAELGPRTVLDVGANTGQYAKLAASSGARVIACEVDVSAVNRCYDDARKRDLNILPLAVNVFNVSPTPGRGGVPSPPAVERFRSEFVMGLAVIHHVVAIQKNTDRTHC